MTSGIHRPENEVQHFYDSLAPDYDAMTGFEKRFVQERPFFSLLIDRYAIRSAIDAGSGTGFHALLLARMNIDVTAIDVSPKMIAMLNRHAGEMKLAIRGVTSPLQVIEKAIARTVDAVFCLGNTLPHLLKEGDLKTVLGGFFAKLNPQGILFLQILNYDRIMQQQERIQSVKESNGTTFVRYYEYGVDFITFHVLKIQRNGSSSHTLNSVTLRPIRKDEIVNLLEKAGFSGIKLFGGISMGEFDLENSKDLVILAQKK